MEADAVCARACRPMTRRQIDAITSLRFEYNPGLKMVTASLLRFIQLPCFRDPLPDIPGAVDERDALRFALAEEGDPLLAGQGDVFQIDRNPGAIGLDERLQFGDVL